MVFETDPSLSACSSWFPIKDSSHTKQISVRLAAHREAKAILYSPGLLVLRSQHFASVASEGLEHTSGYGRNCSGVPGQCVGPTFGGAENFSAAGQLDVKKSFAEELQTLCKSLLSPKMASLQKSAAQLRHRAFAMWTAASTMLSGVKYQMLLDCGLSGGYYCCWLLRLVDGSCRVFKLPVHLEVARYSRATLYTSSTCISRPPHGSALCLKTKCSF